MVCVPTLYDGHTPQGHKGEPIIQDLALVTEKGINFRETYSRANIRNETIDVYGFLQKKFDRDGDIKRAKLNATVIIQAWKHSALTGNLTHLAESVTSFEEAPRQFSLQLLPQKVIDHLSVRVNCEIIR